VKTIDVIKELLRYKQTYLEPCDCGENPNLKLMEEVLRKLNELQRRELKEMGKTKKD
jgi:hypothetical protein